jgi:hypothetical protein
MLLGLNEVPVLAISGPVPAGLQFGSRVIVVWSRHAAVEFADSETPNLPRNAVVMCLDDTPLPAFLSKGRFPIRAEHDGDDGFRLKSALSGVSANNRLARAYRAEGDSPRQANSPVRAKVASSRQVQSASVVVSAGAFGTLTAVALGAVFPGESIVTPSFAANPTNESTTMDARQDHLEQSHEMAVNATFEGVMTPGGVSVTFSADEMQAVTQLLAQSDHDLNAARAWSDGLINRLQGLSARAPDAMPAMGAVPRGPSTSASAQPAEDAASLAQGEPAGDALVLRDRFTQVEPMNYAVDRIADIAAAAPTVERNSGV